MAGQKIVPRIVINQTQQLQQQQQQGGGSSNIEQVDGATDFEWIPQLDGMMAEGDSDDEEGQAAIMETGDEELYAIVGSQEANPMECRISDDSPFGRALLGHCVSETVTVEAPAGVLKYKILSVEK